MTVFLISCHDDSLSAEKLSVRGDNDNIVSRGVGSYRSHGNAETDKAVVWSPPADRIDVEGRFSTKCGEWIDDDKTSRAGRGEFVPEEKEKD